ncbi:MAG TPA: hypothetical protein GX743_05830, partial [Actinomycetales bacterium]|nr:hypothetical protein [Actinomycetales bacterium]
MQQTIGSRLTTTLTLARDAIRMWTPRQWWAAVIGTIAVGLLIGVATVLIPNSLFARDIPPEWWNYPVWIVSSVLMGMLIATYVKPQAASEGAPETPDMAEIDPAGEKRSTRFGAVGGVLAWFAVGCPVCNKIALLALGYNGAMAWFAPLQPVLAVAAMVLAGVALVWRLKGQLAC